MEAKKYIEQLELLAYQMRDDKDLCNTNCSDCALFEKIITPDEFEMTYCGLLVSIINASKEL
jgi:hypothetical protein